VRWTDDVADSLSGLDRSPRALRRFGVTVGGVALLARAALLVAGRHPGAANVLVALGLALLTLGLAAPPVLGPLHLGWMGLAFALGWVVSRALLTLVFLLAVTPLALLARLVGKRFLDLGPDPRASTYWVARPPGRPVRHDKMY
jgi:hypothetical protein